MVMTQGVSRLYKTVSGTTPITLPVLPLTFTFQPIPMGSVWTGTIQVLQAPAWAFHQCTIGGVLWAEWLGFQPSPVIQAMTGEVITVTSTGLSPNTLYQATLIGRTDPHDNYNPVWPEASQNTNLGSNNISEQTVNSPVATTQFNTTIQSGLPGQVLAIQFASAGGTCTGLKIQCSGGPGYRFATLYPQNSAWITPWWFVPIQDTSTTITIDPIAANRVVGGTFGGILRTCVIAGPLFIPVLQSGADIALLGNSIGLTVDQVQAAGSNASIIGSPPTGAIIRVRRVVVIPSVAPAAGGTVLLRGAITAGVYWRDSVNANLLATPASGHTDFYVADDNRDDPVEGLFSWNLSSQDAHFTVEYDIVPFPQGITTAT